MKAIFLSTLSKLINAYLRLDPESRSRLSMLQGKVVTVELLPIHFTFQLLFNPEGVVLEANETHFTDTKIIGTPLQMFGVVAAKKNRHHFFAEDLVLIGDAELAQQVIQVFDELEIDWEEMLSQLIGDVPAYHAAQAVQGIQNWLHQAQFSMTQNLNDYVHEEIKWFPSKEELKDFFSDIDDLRMDVDRVETKIALLEKSLIEDEDHP